MIHDTIYLNKLTILVCCIQGLFGPHDCFHFLGPPLIQQHYKTAKMIKIQQDSDQFLPIIIQDHLI